MLKSPTTGVSGSPLLSDRLVQRVTAALLVLYCVAQVVTIVTRIASGTDMESSAESMAMIAANQSWYLASKIANLVAAFLLLASGVLIYQVFRPCDHALALLAGAFFAVAASFWLLSSLAGLAIVEVLGDSSGPTATYVAGSQSSAFNAIEPVRAIAGRVGFTAAALALAFLGILITFARPMPRWFGWAALATAVAMLFIWDPEASAMHRLGGSALLLWFLAVAAWLALKGVSPRAQGAGQLDKDC